jgi:small subunit ribosomal protein S8e
VSQFGKQFSLKSNTKGSGNGRERLKSRDKRRSEIGNYFSATRVAAENYNAPMRRRGGKNAVKLSHVAFANVLTKDGYKKARIKSVLESRDNRNFARQAIITKGAIIETELGKAVVLNRPGREGSINARLV